MDKETFISEIKRIEQDLRNVVKTYYEDKVATKFFKDEKGIEHLTTEHVSITVFAPLEQQYSRIYTTDENVIGQDGITTIE